jgi:hypothetical protein
VTSLHKLSGIAFGLALLVSREAAAEPERGLGSHQRHFLPSLGVRASFVADEGFDPFATDDVFVQLTVGLARTVFVVGDLSLAVDAHWDYGGRSGQARGLPTELEVHRLSAGPELRYHVLPILYGFSRISPALLNARAALSDDASDVTLYARHWTYGLDATLGATVELYGMESGASNKPRIWASVEGGYGFGAPVDLSFAPDRDETNAPLRLEPVELGELALSGPLFRVVAAVSF